MDLCALMPVIREPLLAAHDFELPKSAFPNAMNPRQVEHLLRIALEYRRVCVIGLGYVGLPTALLFAREGFSVQGVDISPHVLDIIESGRVGEKYPELATWWDSVQKTSQFQVGSQPNPADVFLITTPTPVNPQTKACDLSMVQAAMESLLPVLQAGNLIILESTVPPGTTRNLLQSLIETQTNLRVMPAQQTLESAESEVELKNTVFLCFSPERVLPGNTTDELVNNDRVIGGVTAESALVGQTFLKRVLQGHVDITNDITAEFCKLAENTYRDVNIALANELSLLAEEYGIHMCEARSIINRHPRVNLLKPGIGVGGHCIAVDPWFFVEASPLKTQLIATSRRVNDRMPEYTAHRILQDIEDIQRDLGTEPVRVVLAGLSYKPNIGDTRESPALRVLDHLRAAGLDVVAFDPLIREYEGKTLLDMAQGVDYIAILVCHDQFKEEYSRQLATIHSVMRTPQIRFF
jgi:UDP-N-acetyl-D-mannosaminuronic acid dehydrogenase